MECERAQLAGLLQGEALHSGRTAHRLTQLTGQSRSVVAHDEGQADPKWVEQRSRGVAGSAAPSVACLPTPVRRRGQRCQRRLCSLGPHDTSGPLKGYSGRTGGSPEDAREAGCQALRARERYAAAEASRPQQRRVSSPRRKCGPFKPRYDQKSTTKEGAFRAKLVEAVGVGAVGDTHWPCRWAPNNHGRAAKHGAGAAETSDYRGAQTPQHGGDR